MGAAVVHNVEFIGQLSPWGIVGIGAVLIGYIIIMVIQTKRRD